MVVYISSDNMITVVLCPSIIDPFHVHAHDECLHVLAHDIEPEMHNFNVGVSWWSLPLWYVLWCVICVHC